MKHIKRALLLILCLMLLISTVALGGIVASAEGSYNGITYVVNANNEATITGYSSNLSGNVTIPNKVHGYPVTRIASYAFRNWYSLTGLSVESEQLVIEENAFYYCEHLEYVKIPCNVYVAYNAFFQCSHLSDVYYYVMEGTSTLPVIKETSGTYFYMASKHEIAVTGIVTYDLNGGNINGLEYDVEYLIIKDQTIRTPSNPVCSGFNFVNWELVTQDNSSNGNLYYIAVWEENTTVPDPPVEINYSVGDIIEFGSYPQSRVDDEETITSLNALVSDDDWESYGYFCGTGNNTDGNMRPSNIMSYTDIEYNGEKYRGVIIDSPRPYMTGYQSESSKSIQDDEGHGYYTGIVYWFKYDSLKWRVLDPNEGLVISESIIDSQPFNNVLKYNVGLGKYCTDGNYYASDYSHSYINSWLNNSFTETAFSRNQQAIIRLTTLEPESVNSVTISKKVFLLSYNDLKNTEYGFNSNAEYSDSARLKSYTDYSVCQGLSLNLSSISYSSWLLRTPKDDRYVYDVTGQGQITCSETNYTSSGIVPAIRINLSNFNDPNALQKDIVKFGSYPQSKVTDDELLSELNSLELDWKSYGYYTGNVRVYDGSYPNGEMTPSDFMRYADVKYEGEKYRAVVFDSYRPLETTYISDKDWSYQDENGYEINNVYWFKYEPLIWRVLDSSKGLLMSENLIDSQAYNNYVYYNGYVFEGSDTPQLSFYANNYKYSSIRKWLNDDFYNLAFSTVEQSIIKTTLNENKAIQVDSGTESAQYSAPDTEDKVFLLSFDDIRNYDYGFNEDYNSVDNNRILNSSDYANCQGLNAYPYVENEFYGNHSWWLRNPGSNEVNACEISARGTVGAGWANGTYNGICPAICVEEIHNESDAVIENEKPATCTEKGSYDKVYYCSFCGDEIRRETYETPATGIHSWKYATDKYTITASCEKCTETFSITAILPENLKCSDTPKEITLEGEIPDGFVTTVTYNTEDGQAPKKAGTYTAHVYLTPDDLSDVILASIDIELKIEHDLTSHEGKAATCEEDGYEPYVDCSCGYTTYKTIPAKNHNYQITYDWSDDGKSCYATATCSNDSSHSFGEKASISSVVKVKATCTEKGTTTYIASFNNKFFDAQTKDVVDIPPIEHNYVVSYEWSDDGKSCVATAVCANDSQHTFSEEATIGKSVKVNPTCTENGTTTYTASFTNELFSDQTKDVVDIPPKEHNYAVSYEWSDDGKSCVATAICANDSQHTFSENATIGKAVKVNPTCTKPGITTYTASFGNKFFAAQTKDVTDIPAKGHVVIIKNATDPTCTVSGYTGTEFCSVCNQTLRTGEEIQPLGHSFTNYIYNNNATYEKDGTETAKCDRCNETYTRIKPGTKLINPTAKAKINVAAPITLDYRTKVTIKATASNLDPAYHLVLCINGKEYEGNNKEVSHNYGEIKGDINYFVKIVDASGKIQKDANGAELKKDGGKITCNAGFFQKIIAFFKGLFNALPEKTVKP